MFHVTILDKGKVIEGVLKDLNSQKTAWLDIENPTQVELQHLETLTGLPSREVEGWLSGKKRPVTTDLKEYSLVIFRIPTKIGERVMVEPCVILISKQKKDFLTVHKYPSTVFSRIHDYTKHHLKELYQNGSTALLYTFMNEAVDDFHELLDRASEIIDQTEETIFSLKNAKKTMQDVFRVKETLIYFHKALMMNREVIASIEKEYVAFLDHKYLPLFRSLEIALNQLIELNNTYRDILNSATEIHLTAVSNNLNVTMKKVTSWAAIILIPSLIASVYGMNFEFFPGLDWKYGVHFSIGLMAGSVLLLYWYFKKRDWM